MTGGRATETLNRNWKLQLLGRRLGAVLIVLSDRLQFVDDDEMQVAYAMRCAEANGADPKWSARGYDKLDCGNFPCVGRVRGCYGRCLAIKTRPAAGDAVQISPVKSNRACFACDESCTRCA